MEVEFQNNREDLIDFYKIQLVDIFKRSYLSIIICLGVITVICLGNPFKWALFLISISAYSFIIASFYLIMFCKGLRRLNKEMSDEKAYSEKRKVIIDEYGLTTIGSEKNITRNWDSIVSINSNKRFIYIRLIDKKVLVLAKKWFSSDIEMANFMGAIRSKIIKYGGPKPIPFIPTINQPGQKLDKNATTYYPKPKPPYLLGLLGVIPLVGAFVGFALILYGVIKYKDKWLVLIGVGGILFTVLIYGSLFYSSKHSKVFINGFAAIDTMELNALVKEIEFYKLQTGSYPDSLAQINAKGNLASTSDPLLNGKKDDSFNYHKIGIKYTLFSSGIDKTPNTADDIYPTVDTTHTGLIIKR